MKLNIAATLLALTATLTGCGKSSSETQTGNNDTTTTTMNTTVITDSVAPGDAFVNIETSLGNIRVQLYGDTPQHRDNFLKLAREGYYNGVLFHRVIRDFMIQTGDPDSKNAKPGQMLGAGDPGYTIPAEFVYPKHFHRYGALAAARTGDNVNPERRSSGSQFYIVTGQKYPKTRLEQYNMMLKQRGIPAFTDEQMEAYETVGGAPHLDGQYTVFGQVVDGMDVVEKIQSTETNSMDRPVNDIKVEKITVE